MTEARLSMIHGSLNARIWLSQIRKSLQMHRPVCWQQVWVMRLQPGMKGKPADRIRMEFILQSLRPETELCKEIITADGLAAYRAVLTKSVTPQLENVIEANCFLSGIGGLNSGGCAAGHGIGDWLAGIPGGHSFTHGERVFIGLLIQTVLEEYPMEETISLIKFGRAVGLPCCIGDMGVEDVKAIAKQAGKELLNDHFMVNPLL